MFMSEKDIIILDVVDDNIDIDLSAIDIVRTTPQTEQPIIEPKTTEQVITPSQDKYFDKVTVNAVTSDIDSNIVPENIKAGKTILGVVGNVEPDKPDQSKTVTPTEEQQIVRADTGYELASVTVEPIPTKIVEISPTESEQVVDNSNGQYIKQATVKAIPNDYIGSGIERVTQITTITPTEQSQTVSGNKFFEQNIVVEPIPDDYIGSAIPQEQEKTITPTVTNQTINANTYLAGTQTILGDTNLEPANIVKGKSIFGVQGTAEVEQYANSVYNYIKGYDIMYFNNNGGELPTDEEYDSLTNQAISLFATINGED